MNSQLATIGAELRNKNYNYVEQLCWEFLKNHKDHFHALKALALSLLMQKKKGGAIEIYEKLHKRDANDIDIIVNLSNLYLSIEEFQKTSLLLEKALTIQSENYLANLNKADLLFKSRDYENAKIFCEKAISLSSKNDEYAYNQQLVHLYGDVLIALNDTDGAIEFVKKCFEINQDTTDLYYLINLKRDLFERHEIDKFVEKKLSINFKTESQKFMVLAPMYFALGRYSESFNKGLSEGCYIKANDISSKVQRFQPLEHQRHIKNIKKIFLQQKEIIKNDYDQTLGKENIFVVGMPRSGTTLVESMIATNDNVISGGEMISMPQLLRKYYEKDVTELPDLSEVAKNYSERMNFIRKNKSFFLDKLPANFYHIGIILLALPQAKIIHIQRDPWDVAISLFKQQYISNIPFASKFFSIACTIANYQHLMSFWEENLPDKIHHIKYEDLVSSPQEHGQEMFKFIKIDEKFDIGKRESFFSRTASKVQVKQEIHTKSLKKEEFVEFKEKFMDDFRQQNKYWEKQ